MDFTPLSNALGSKSYGNIADICDELIVKAAAEGVPFQDDWPYAIHLLGYIYLNDVNSARFLWKTIPSVVKDSQPEVVSVWAIGQKLWTNAYPDVHEAVRSFDWSEQTRPLVAAFAELYSERMFKLLLSAYSTISVQDTALFLGMNEEDATNYVVQQGWSLDSDSQMLTVKKTVKKQPAAMEQKRDPSKLQRLTEYVFHLEH